MNIKLSVIIPVYNEEATLLKMLKQVAAVSEIEQIIIVDDGSQDNSLSIAQNFIKNLAKKEADRFQLLTQDNQGKGKAVRTGLEKVTGNYVLIQDADLEYDPQDIKPMLEAASKERISVVYGSRFLGPHSNLLFWHRAGNWFLNLVVNILYNTTLSDMETCYKLIPTKLMRELDLQANSFDLEPEITCKILKRGIHIFEVPITYIGRGFEEGKKITWWDGWAALQTIIKLRLQTSTEL